jgi:hypothetical protein
LEGEVFNPCSSSALLYGGKRVDTGFDARNALSDSRSADAQIPGEIGATARRKKRFKVACIILIKRALGDHSHRFVGPQFTADPLTNMLPDLAGESVSLSNLFECSMTDKSVADGSDKGKELSNGVAFESSQSASHELKKDFSHQLFAIGRSENVGEASASHGLDPSMRVPGERGVESARLHRMPIA